MNKEKLFYDKKGNPINLRDWEILFDRHNRIIEQDVLINGKFVSTVWVGIDLSVVGNKPLIFETRVFAKYGSYDDIDCDRYATEEEAREGHKRMVEKHRKKEKLTTCKACGGDKKCVDCSGSGECSFCGGTGVREAE